MKRILALVLLCILLTVPFASAAEPSVPCKASGACRSPAITNDAFAVQLYGELAKKPGNLFFSPYSISNAVAMARAGARGETAKEIDRTLHFPSDQARLNEAFKRVNKDLPTLAKRDGVRLDIANGLALTGGAVKKSFETVLKDDYDAEIFSGGVGQINDWVRRKTGGKIPSILDRLPPGSACVILNAIYFKGLWKSQFSRKNTRNAPFHVSSTRQATAPLMYQRGRFKLLEAKNFQAVSMDYKGGDLSMVILLPEKTEGLADFEKSMTPQKLGRWLQSVDTQPFRQIDLYVPKFRMETSYDLKSPFQNLGMRKPFEPGADFSGMGEGLWIGQIKHKCFLKVDEKGTEAAAATATRMMTAVRRPLTIPVFRADHPFIFLIRDNRNGLILFLGRVTDPTRGAAERK
ncbi:MAG: serpin family protein [Syntrophobacteraceae bacterium]